MIKYMLRLLPNGDIDIISDEFVGGYTIVYHKTYNPGDDLKENLDNAYKEWKRLRGEKDEKDVSKTKTCM